MELVDLIKVRNAGILISRGVLFPWIRTVAKRYGRTHRNHVDDTREHAKRLRFDLAKFARMWVRSSGMCTTVAICGANGKQGW